MLFPAPLVYSACMTLLEESPQSSLNAYKILHPNQEPVGDEAALLAHFLNELPTPDKQLKITNRLRDIAIHHRAQCEQFAWWNIMPGEHWLFAELTRGGQKMMVVFIWKRQKKDGPASNIVKQEAEWVRDVQAPDGWRFQFFCTHYKKLLELFEAWLKKPLELPDTPKPKPVDPTVHVESTYRPSP